MPHRFLCAFLALLSPAIAQEIKIEKKADTGVQVRFLAEQAPENLGKVFLSFGEAKSPAVNLPTNQLSDEVPVSARTMILKTVEKEVPLCNITLPEAGKAFAVVLVTAKPAGYLPIVVRTDDPSFKEGDVFFINRSAETVLGKLGKTPLVLKPGEVSKSHPTGPVDNSYYDIAFAVHGANGDKLISSSRWPLDSQLRSYVFFFTNAKGRTTYRAVDEYLPPPAAKKP